MKFLISRATLSLGWSAALAFFTPGCGDSPPSPEDASVPADRPAAPTCAVRFDRAGVVRVATSERVTLGVQLTPARAATEVRLGLVGDALDGSLSDTRAVTNESGAATFTLTAPSEAASFRVRATPRCGTDVFLDVSVSDRGFGSLFIDATYRGNRSPSSLVIDLLRASSCTMAPVMGPDRTVVIEDTGSTVQFNELPSGLDYVVRGVARGATADVELATACAGPFRVTPGEVARTVLVFNDAPLTLGDRYDLALGFNLSTPASSIAASWTSTVASEVMRAGGDTTLWGDVVSEAVGVAAGPANQARERAAFDTAWRARLAPLMTTTLTRQNALLAPSFARLADSVAGIVATAQCEAAATAVPMSDARRFTLDNVRCTLDSGTADVRGDDVRVTVPGTAALRLSPLLMDTFMANVDRFPLPWALLSSNALSGGLLPRLGVSSSAEYVALAVCPSIISVVRGSTASCTDRCLLEACRRTIDRFDVTFRNALVANTPPRDAVDLRAPVTARALAGERLTDRLTGAANGEYVGDPMSSVSSTLTLARHTTTP